MNPYIDDNFFTFFLTLFCRLKSFLLFQIPLSELKSDEIQLGVLLFSSVSSAIVGVWLTLRKMTMLANALSHTILLGIVIAFLCWRNFYPFPPDGIFSIPFIYLLGASVLMGLVTTYLTYTLQSKGRIQEDASVGLIFTTLFALGVLLVNITTRNAHVGVEAVMGNVDALTLHDLSISFPICLVNIVATYFFYKELLVSTFDPAFAQSQGYSSHLITYLLMTLVSVTVISQFESVGVIMVLAFLTTPAIIARRFTNSVSSMIKLACWIGALTSLVGVALSRHILNEFGLPLSTGGIIVTLLTLLTLTSFSYSKLTYGKSH